MYPIPVLHPRLHLLLHLTGILLALKLALGGKDGFYKLAFGGIVKAEIEAFDFGIAHPDGFAQCEMEVAVTGKALEIIEDDDKALIGLGIHKREQRRHAGTVHEVTFSGHNIGENSSNLITPNFSVLTTPGFLRVKAVAIFLLPG
jgi:hypothetical protein